MNKTRTGDVIRQFRHYEVVVKFAQYANGRTAIELRDAHDGSPVAWATVNLPAENMDTNEVAIKDYSENEGMLLWLMEQGIVSEPKRIAFSGYTAIDVCELLTDSNGRPL